MRDTDLLAARLKATRLERNLTQEEVGNKIGVHKSTIMRWENGEGTGRIKPPVIEALASILDVTPAYLMGWEDEGGIADLVLGEIDHSRRTGIPIDEDLKNAEYIATSGQSPKIDFGKNLCRSYPVIGEVAAGFGSEAVEEETGDYEQIPLEWLRGHNPDNFFVLRVKGDSMYPDFQDGDHVLVHRQTSVDSGTVAVMLYDSEVATLKKVRYKKGEDWVELIPRNPEYQTKRIENWDLNECRVLGEVKRLIRVVR